MQNPDFLEIAGCLDAVVKLAPLALEDIHLEVAVEVVN